MPLSLSMILSRCVCVSFVSVSLLIGSSVSVPVPVSGALPVYSPGMDGGVANQVWDSNLQPRLPLEVFFKNSNQPMYELFLLAVQQMQLNSQTYSSDPEGYFELAAIHGQPFNYDSVPSYFVSSSCINASPPCPGYGHHDDDLFATWHRAYLLLFETALQNAAKQVIKALVKSNLITLQQQNLGNTYANNLRIPYWDFAAEPIANPTATYLTFPSYLRVAEWTINNWGPVRTIPNPLRSYALPAASNNVLPPLTTLSIVLSTGVDSNDNPTVGTTTTYAIGAGATTPTLQGLRDTIHNILQITDWTTFSTKLEQFHGSIHTWIGGTMSDIPDSSFSPSFWFLHSNIDRLINIYQQYQPNIWFVEEDQPVATWATPAGTTAVPYPLTGSSALAPFRVDALACGADYRSTCAVKNSGFVSSDNLKDITQWGYTYPELSYITTQGWNLDQTRSYIDGLFPTATMSTSLSLATPMDPSACLQNYADLLQVAICRNNEIVTDNTAIPTRGGDVQWQVQFTGFPINYFGPGRLQIDIYVSTDATPPTGWPNPNVANAVASLYSSHPGPAASISPDTSVPRIKETFTVSITPQLIELGLLVTSSSHPPTTLVNNVWVTISGPAVTNWYKTATTAQINRKNQDMAAQLFTPDLLQTSFPKVITPYSNSLYPNPLSGITFTISVNA